MLYLQFVNITYYIILTYPFFYCVVVQYSVDVWLSYGANTVKQSLDCTLWVSQLLSTTREGGIGTCLGCGNVVSPSNQPTVIVGTINKQVKQHSWRLI